MSKFDFDRRFSLAVNMLFAAKRINLTFHDTKPDIWQNENQLSLFVKTICQNWMMTIPPSYEYSSLSVS